MNVATTSKDIKVLKCRHGKHIYKYLCQLSTNLWCVLVYGEDDETLEWDNVAFSYADALYIYNHYEEEEKST